MELGFKCTWLWHICNEVYGNRYNITQIKIKSIIIKIYIISCQMNTKLNIKNTSEHSNVHVFFPLPVTS